MSSVRQTSFLLPLFLTTTTHHLWLSLFFFLDKTLRIIAVEIAVHLLLPFYSLHLDQSLSTNLGHLPAYYVWGGILPKHMTVQDIKGVCPSSFWTIPLSSSKMQSPLTPKSIWPLDHFPLFDIHKSHPSSCPFKKIGVYQLNLQTTSPRFGLFVFPLLFRNTHSLLRRNGLLSPPRLSLTTRSFCAMSVTLASKGRWYEMIGRGRM